MPRIDSPRQLTDREYHAIRKFLMYADERVYGSVTSDVAAGVVTIDGERWTVYRDGFYLTDRGTRLETAGVTFTDPKGPFTDFEEVIAWAESQ